MIPWVIQSNVGPHEDVRDFWAALKARGNPRCKVSAPPFLDTPKDCAHRLEAVFKEATRHGVKPFEPCVWMGGVGFVETLRKTGLWKDWIFTDPERFNLRAYSEHWGACMLNSEGAFTTMGKFLELAGPPDELIFCRPVQDLKEFPGNVIERINLRRWVQTIRGRGFQLDENCEIYVGPPHGIAAEWRMFMVDGKAVTGSYYTSDQYAPIGYAPPKEVIEYAEGIAACWSPAPMFSLDICRSGENLFVMEAGSIHSSGLYRSSAVRIVEAVSDYFEKGM